ncbi:MAG: hypothetical protein U0Q22_19525 [Acidimicrobiales bacterium]
MTAVDLTIGVDEGRSVHLQLTDAWRAIDPSAPDLADDLALAIVEAEMRYATEELEASSDGGVPDRSVWELTTLGELASMVRSSVETTPSEAVRLVAVDVLHPDLAATTMTLAFWAGADEPDGTSGSEVVAQLVGGLRDEVRAGLVAEDLVTSESVVTLVTIAPDYDAEEHVALAVGRPLPGLSIVFDGRARGPQARAIAEVVERIAISTTATPSTGGPS